MFTNLLSGRRILEHHVPIQQVGPKVRIVRQGYCRSNQ